MARAATRLQRQAEIFPIALRGLGIFETAPPAGVRVPAGDGAHYLQYSGLPNLFILNGFIQSLVGLYDFAALTGDATARSLFDAGDLAARKEVPTFDTGAWSLYSRGSSKTESDLGYHKLLRDFLTQLCKRTTTIQYCSAEQHFTAVPDRRAGRPGAAADADRQEVRKAALQALEDLADHGEGHARDDADRDDQPGSAGARDQDAGLDGAEEDRRVLDDRDRHGPGWEHGERRR